MLKIPFDYQNIHSSNTKLAEFIKQHIGPHLSENGPWLSGGCLRRLIDEDFRSTFDIDIFHTEYPVAIQPYKIKSYTVQITVSGTKNVFSNVEELLNSIDFTICKLATDGKFLYYHEDAFRHIHEQKLSIPNDFKISLPRIVRYMHYGFVPDEALFKRISDMTSIETAYYYNKVDSFNDYHGLFGQLVKSENFHDNMVLSRCGPVYDIVDGNYWLYFDGCPVPLHLALMLLICPNVRNDIRRLLINQYRVYGIDNWKTPVEYKNASWIGDKLLEDLIPTLTVDEIASGVSILRF